MRANRIAILVVTAVVLGGVAFGQPTGGWSANPADQSNVVFQQYAAATQTWVTVAQKYAKALFVGLALVDFAWTMALVLLEGGELQSIVVKLIKWIMKTGFFLALLMNGQQWMGAIIGSFIKIGQEAGGGGAITPGAIMMSGLAIAGKLVWWSTKMLAVPLVGTGVGIIGLLCALLVTVAFAIVVLNFLITTIESFLVLGAGFIFLGFGGSQWTRPYVERYLGLAASVGTRLMVLYMVAGLGVTFGAQWLAIVNNLGGWQDALVSAATGGDPVGKAMLDILGVLAGAFTYAGVAVMAPKLIASVASGALSMSASDGIGFAVGAGMAGAAIASGGAGAMTKLGASLSSGGAGAAAGTGAAGMGGTLSAGSPVFATSPGGASSSVGSQAMSTVSSGVGSGGSAGSVPGLSGGVGSGGGGQRAAGNESGAPNYVAPPSSDTGGTGRAADPESWSGGGDVAQSMGAGDAAVGSSAAVPPQAFERSMSGASIRSTSGQTASNGPQSMPENTGVGTAGGPERYQGSVAPSVEAALVGNSRATLSTGGDGAGATLEGKSTVEGSSSVGVGGNATGPAVETGSQATAGGPTELVSAATHAVAAPVVEADTLAAGEVGPGGLDPAIETGPVGDVAAQLNTAPGGTSPVAEAVTTSAASMPPVAGSEANSPKAKRSLTEKMAALQYVRNITDIGHAVAPPPPPVGSDD